MKHSLKEADAIIASHPVTAVSDPSLIGWEPLTYDFPQDDPDERIALANSIADLDGSTNGRPLPFKLVRESPFTLSLWTSPTNPP